MEGMVTPDGNKHILILSFSEISRDPRVSRQLATLAGRYQVTVIGYGELAMSGVRMVTIAANVPSLRSRLAAAWKLLLGSYEAFYWGESNVREALIRGQDIPCDLVLANDLDSLPLALRLADGRPVVCDAHEYAPREFEDNVLWRLFFMRFKEFLCRKYLPRCARVTTVCRGIADEYLKHFGVLPEVVTNASDYVESSPSPVESGQIRLIHHGGANPSRCIELMIRMMEYLDERFSLTLMLMANDPAYYDRLKRLASGNARIIFRDPVPFSAIVATLNSYDMGVYILKPNSFNNRHALPNKFFEFIQARLAVAIGPSPEMAGIVKEYDLGIVAADFNPETLAGSLNTLTREQVEHHKNRSHQAALALSSEANRKKLLTIVEPLIDDKVQENANACVA
jgi:hypothetical protein